MIKDRMIAINAYCGDNWKTAGKDMKDDLRNIGIHAQVIARNRRYRIRFHSSNDLNLAILSGILEHIDYNGSIGRNVMEGYRYVKSYRK